MTKWRGKAINVFYCHKHFLSMSLVKFSLYQEQEVWEEKKMVYKSEFFFFFWPEAFLLLSKILMQKVY